MKKIIFIGHPIRGAVEENMKKVLTLCEEVHKQGNIPVAPYLVSLQYLDDTVVEDRELGIESNHLCFHKHFVDELWLYGDHISQGMEDEVRVARANNIPVFPKTEGTKRDLQKLLSTPSLHTEG